MKNNELSRMTVDIPTELYKMLKTRAIREDKSLREVVIECLEESKASEYEACPYDHTPNARTIKSIEEVKKGKGLHKAKDACDLAKQLGTTFKKRKKSNKSDDKLADELIEEYNDTFKKLAKT